MAHLHCAWAHLEDSAGLGRARYAARFAESLLKASGGAQGGQQEIEIELRSVKARISQLEEQRAALQEIDLYSTLGLAHNASNRDIREVRGCLGVPQTMLGGCESDRLGSLTARSRTDGWRSSTIRTSTRGASPRRRRSAGWRFA
eukprot:4595213-Prymnesium_polylepis.1